MIPRSVLVDICGLGQPMLARTAAGLLMVNHSSGWESFDFNLLYAGQYPACRFTALAYAGQEFFLAGLDEFGHPHLFTSLLGGVWALRTLTASHPLLGTQQVSSEIVQILHDADQDQTFLISRSGQLATLADCPRCIRIRQVTDDGLVGGQLADGLLQLQKADGSEITIPVSDAVQVRVAKAFALDHLQSNPGVIVDLRSPVEFAEGRIPGSIPISMNDLYDWLGSQTSAISVFFICRTGLLADDAARLARAQGFRQAWSLGGIRFLSE